MVAGVTLTATEAGTAGGMVMAGVIPTPAIAGAGEVTGGMAGAMAGTTAGVTVGTTAGTTVSTTATATVM